MRTPLVLAVMLFASPALAQVYCRADVPNGRIYDGAVVEHRGTVTRESARRKGATKWCSTTITTLGGVERVQLVERPKIGRAANPRRYVVAYRSNTVGQDTFAVRIFWRTSGTALQSALVRFTVNVVDRPL